MCGGRRQSSNIQVQVPRPAAPPDPAPAVAPVVPAQLFAAKPITLRETEEVAVRPQVRRRQRERAAIRQGTSQLRMPLNTGTVGTSGGLNA